MAALGVVLKDSILCTKCQQGYLHPNGAGGFNPCSHCTILCSTKWCQHPAYISSTGKVSKWCNKCYDPTKANRGRAKVQAAIPGCTIRGCKNAAFITKTGKVSILCSKCFENSHDPCRVGCTNLNHPVIAVRRRISAHSSR
jgi:hypothetical protein